MPTLIYEFVRFRLGIFMYINYCITTYQCLQGVIAIVDKVFIETHEDPDTAPSDGPNMVPLRDMPALLRRLKAFDDLAKQAG